MSAIGASYYLRHFGPNHSQEIIDFADKLFPDYIFTRRIGKQQYGYCTACRNEFRTANFRHKDHIHCPECGKAVTVQSAGMSRSSMINEVYFIYYEKSIIDPEVIVARGVYGAEDYTVPDYKRVRPKLTDRTLYVFKIGECVMLKRYACFSWCDHDVYPKGFDYFETARTIHSELHRWAMNNWSRGTAAYSRDSIKKAVKGTPFRYSCWQQYDDEPMVKFFELYCNHPKAVEYLTKLGFENFIDAKLTGSYTYGAINWKGKTVFKMLRVNRGELKAIRGSDLVITPFFMRLYQLNKGDRNGYNLMELKTAESVFECVDIKDINIIAKMSTLKKAFNYVKEQYEKCIAEDGIRKQFYSIRDTVTNYRDYLSDCKELEMDLKDERVLFPKNLYAAHQNTIKQVEIKANEKLENDFAARYELLSAKYSFKRNGLIIRPVMTVKELIEEGKALNHCVGTYAERHARGSCSIFLIRQASAPDKPYYTLELRNDRIIQTRGKNNCITTPKIDKFLEIWTEEKIFQKSKREKIKVTVPA